MISPHLRVHPLPYGSVRWTAGFWADRFSLVHSTIIPAMRESLLDPDNGAFLGNFEPTAAEHKATFWSDGDCYKWLEACAHAYRATGDADLLRDLNSWVGKIAAVQAPDGYIGTQIQLDSAKARWSARRHHELYNMGHLLSAACAHRAATGSESFLGVAIRLADYLCETFGSRPAELAHFGWNPSQIMGLVDLYRATREKKCLELAQTFVDMRGSTPWPEDTNDPDPGDQNQDRVPLRQESQAVGHAVTAAYLWCGAADIFAETGENVLLSALERLWSDVIRNKMYITGGIGALHEGISPRGDRIHEAFGKAGELPSETAYNETCANIGNAMWNQRMLRITGEARFADVMEKVLYNSALSGISLDGRRFFYTNPLARNPAQRLLRNDSAERWRTWPCYCCPPQVARTLAGLSEWVYGLSDDQIWLHLYGGSELDVPLRAGGRFRLRQETDYPWDGDVDIKILESPRRRICVALRIPAWAESASIRANGKRPFARIRPGSYVSIARNWNAGDRITVKFPMRPRLVAAGPEAAANPGRIAVMFGPLVYCLESHDLPAGTKIEDFRLPPGVLLCPLKERETLAGAVQLAGRAAGGAPFRLIPYYAWQNRGPAAMRVWLPFAG